MGGGDGRPVTVSGEGVECLVGAVQEQEPPEVPELKDLGRLLAVTDANQRRGGDSNPETG
jgi:hypothetical protein